MPASREAPAKLSQIPVRPRGHRSIISMTENIRAVDTEIMEVSFGFSMASMKLWVAYVTYLDAKVKFALTRLADARIMDIYCSKST